MTRSVQELDRLIDFAFNQRREKVIDTYQFASQISQLYRERADAMMPGIFKK